MLQLKPLPWDGDSKTVKGIDGKVVIAPGMYTLPDRDLYPKTAGVSKSRIGNFHRAAVYDWAQRNHPEWFPAKGAQVLGNVIDTLLFDPGGFDKYFVTPDDFDLRSKANKEQMAKWKEHYGEDKVIHGEKEKSAYGRAETLVKNIQKREACRWALSDGHPHIAVYWDDEMTGLRCKAELDYIREDGDGLIISDLKTTTDASQDAFDRTYGSLLYDIQAAFFSDGVQACTGIEPAFLFVVSESSPPYEAAEYEPEPAEIHEAREHYQVLMRYIRWCFDNGDYPGYPELRRVKRPRFSRRLSLEGGVQHFHNRGIKI